MPLINSMGNLKLMPNTTSTVPGTFRNFLTIITDSLAGVPTSPYTNGKYLSTGGLVIYGTHLRGGAEYDGYVAVTDSYGNIITQKIYISPQTQNQYALTYLGCLIDSADNIFMFGQYSIVGPGNSDSCFVTRLDSSLNYVWQKRLVNTPVVWGSNFAGGIINESNNNLYVVGWQDTSGTTTKPIIAKYDSTNGTLISATVFSTATVKIKGLSITKDSSSYYVCGSSYVSGAYGVILTKFSLASDTWQWSIKYNLALTAGNQVSKIVTDTNGNTFIATYDESGSNVVTVYLAKFNSSGVLQWQRKTSISYGGTYIVVFDGLTIDSSGNVYVSILTDVFTTPVGYFITKFNTSGTVLWQNKITPNPGVYPTTTYSDGHISWRGGKLFVGMNTQLFTPKNAYDFSLPDDGSLTGTYTDFTYSTSTTFSWVTATQTVTNLVNTSTAVTGMADQVGAATIGNGTATQTVTPLP